MAEIVDGFPKREKYPWHEFLDGKVRKLIPSEDYKCDTDSFTIQFRKHAKAIGLKAKVRTFDDCIFIQALPNGKHEDGEKDTP